MDGAAKIKNLVAAAKNFGMSSLAITDHGTMYGVVDFYKACKKEGIKPIIGCEVYVASRTRFDKKVKKDDFQYHLVLLARNNTGYNNLMKLVSQASTEGFYYKPRVDRELLEKYSDGMIALSACLAGEVPTLLMQGKREKAAEKVFIYQKMFGKENYYLEIQNYGLPEQIQLNKELFLLSQKTGAPLVATNDVHYLEKEDAEAHDILLCIQTGKNIDDEKRMKFPGSEFYLKSAEEMSKLFSDLPEALENTKKIAARCDVDFDFDKTFLPHYEVPPNYSENDYLKKLCWDGLKDRYTKITTEISERIEYELEVISKMKYASYFLIVWDFISFARKNNILVGPGRGSAAGSLVAYALKITDIDPLRYGLLFERFLNPERITMPDIDIDFCYEKREKVIQYVVSKYGTDRVAQIITFGTMAARAAVRDVGRALNFSYAEIDKLAKMIPIETGMTIKNALEQSPELKEIYENDKRFTKLINISLKLEGLPRHASTHAAGVVISRDPLVNHVPLQKTGNNIVTQFPMGTLEDLGLLKMDFLGLKTLTLMEETVNIIKRSSGEDISLEDIPLKDKNTFKLLSRGETTGVFQLESSGMRAVLKELKPTTFEDIIAVVALYRPGPMEQISTFIKSKHGKISIKYLHPHLEPILKETYGVMVYQEQIIQIASKLAGFSLGQADLLRRAIGKKKAEILNEQRKMFVEGCVKKDYSRRLANELYELILKFASYGFNKSHAAAYALIAYQTAYLKANYAVEFMAATLTNAMSFVDKIPLYINDCQKQGIEVLPPDINESYINFTVTAKNKIRFGLAAIKNVGLAAIESIIKTRETEGEFQSLRDFCSRVNLRTCNKKAIESLLKSGAFDTLKGHRSQLLAILPETMAIAHQEQKDKENGQMSFADMVRGTDFGKQQDILKDNLPEIKDISAKEKLLMEKEVLGLYISGHPLQQYKELLMHIPNLMPVSDLPKTKDKKAVTVAGLINSVKSIITKKGKPMCFLEIEDLTGSLEVVVFTDTYEKYRSLLVEDKVVLVKGVINSREEEEKKVICKEISLLQDEPLQLFLKIEKKENVNKLFELKELLVNEPGNIPVYLYFSESSKVILTEEKCWVKEEEALFTDLKQLLGEKNVALKKSVSYAVK